MAEHEDAVDIPEPDEALPDAPAVDTTQVDPGGDIPPPHREPELGEDPAYDPGGMGRQPDIAEESEDYG